MDSKCVMDNIKSDFFILRIFDLMPKNISFSIFKYNKKLQERMNLTIKDFIDIYELYAPTKIEITPLQNTYGKFINVKENEKKYYHIYFNDDKEEFKNKYFINEEDKVSKIKIIIDYQATSLNELFKECNCIKSIDFKKYCRKKRSFSKIFSRCSSLKELSLSYFYNNDISDMSYTLCGCSSLEKLYLSNFNNNKVTRMLYAFNDCSSLKEVTLSNFYNNDISNMDYAFDDCSILEKLNLSNFNNNKVNSMFYAFNNCSILEKLYISNFNNNKVNKMLYAFSGCSSLKAVNINNSHNNQIRNMAFTFSKCSDELKINNNPFSMFNKDLTFKK